MNDDRRRLQQQCDQALRDLVDLDRQVAEDELPADVADELRAGYERTAATALATLSEAPEIPTEPAGPVRSRSRARLAMYALTLAWALFAAAVLLPNYLGDRMPGRAVTGNEVFGSAPGTNGAGGQSGRAPTRDLSTVTNKELEAVVAENPDIIDMRLALAGRYTDDGDYLAAARHYLVALRQEPRNAEAQAHYGWLLLQLGEPQQAMEYVDRALTQDPRQIDALWFKANIALYGLSDASGAVTVLTQLQQRADLDPAIRGQVDTLVEAARQQEAGR